MITCCTTAEQASEQYFISQWLPNGCSQPQNPNASHLMQNALVDQMCQELGCCNGDRLVIALVGPLELGNHSVAQQFTKLWELGVHHTDEGSI